MTPQFDEEQATQRRARVLGLDYFDTSPDQQPSKPLFKDLLSIPDLYKMKVVPIQADKSTIFFGITTTTSQQTISDLQKRFLDQRLGFAIISDTGFRDYMRLYDPPKEVVYQDVAVNQLDSTEKIGEISAMLEQVHADDMLAYLVSQAHRLNASDIHLETQPDEVRIRLRIDGVLHPIAELKADKYRVLIQAIASAGNVSTSSDEAQQGHIAQRVHGRWQ